jgi:tetratricopeptide (TPR) repeat protein
MGKASKKKRALTDRNRTKENDSIKAVTQETEGAFQWSAAKTAPLFPIVIILAVSFSAHFNTLFNDFVYDDSSQVLKNYLIRDIRNIPQIFTRSVWAFQSAPIISNYYRPLMNVIYLINYYLFGLKPWGFHLVNILFHAGVSVMVYLLASRLFADKLAGWQAGKPASALTSLLSVPIIAALLFAVHPIHTEAVAWVAGIPDLSFTLFCLLSFYFYIRSKEGLRNAYSVSVAMFLFACFSKEPALTLPLILIGYDYLFGNAENNFWSRSKRYLPYFIVAGIYLALRLYALGEIAPQRRHEYLSTFQYIINIFPLFSQYLGKLILPINLNAFYVFHPIASFFETKGILSVVVAAVFLTVTALTWRRNTVVCFSLLLIVIPLLPVFYIRGLGLNTFAERYLYLPSVGFVFLLAILLTRIAGRSPKGAVVLISSLALIMALCLVETIKRNAVWKSDYTLFKDTVRKSPDGAIAHEKFATALMGQNQLDEAIKHYHIALGLDYYYDDAHTNLGIAYYRKGLIDQAIEEERLSIKLYPNNPETHFNLAQQLADKQMWAEAIQEYEIAVKLAPNFADAHNGLGFAYAMVKAIDKAIEQFEIAARLEPNNPMYRKNLSRAYEMRKEEIGKGGK